MELQIGKVYAAKTGEAFRYQGLNSLNTEVVFELLDFADHSTGFFYRSPLGDVQDWLDEVELRERVFH